MVMPLVKYFWKIRNTMMMGTLEWKIGLPWAYTRGILNSPS